MERLWEKSGKFDSRRLEVWESKLDEFRNWRTRHKQLKQEGRGCYVKIDQENPKERFYPVLVEFAELKGRVLDIGCGSGSVRKHLPESAEYTGVDPIIVNPDDTQIIEAVGEDLPFSDGRFDQVVTYASLDHVFDVESVFRECNRVLQPGGLFTVEITTDDRFYRVLHEGIHERSLVKFPYACYRLLRRLVGRWIIGDHHLYHFMIVDLLDLYHSTGFDVVGLMTTPGDHPGILIKGRKRDTAGAAAKGSDSAAAA